MCKSDLTFNSKASFGSKPKSSSTFPRVTCAIRFLLRPAPSFFFQSLRHHCQPRRCRSHVALFDLPRLLLEAMQHMDSLTHLFVVHHSIPSPSVLRPQLEHVLHSRHRTRVPRLLTALQHAEVSAQTRSRTRRKSTHPFQTVALPHDGYFFDPITIQLTCI